MEYSVEDFLVDYREVFSTELALESAAPNIQLVVIEKLFALRHGWLGHVRYRTFLAVVQPLRSYLESKRPELAKELKRVPESLLRSLHILVIGRKNLHPSSQEIDLQEAQLSPKS